MKAILFCGKEAEELPWPEIPEALLPLCNIPLLAHILRYLEKNGFTEAVILHGSAEVRALVKELPLTMPVFCRETIVTDAPTLVLRRLCLPDWDMGELHDLCRSAPVRLISEDGEPVHGELHPAGSALEIPQKTAAVILSAFHRAENREEFLRLQASLLPETERFRLRAGLCRGKNAQIDEKSVLGTDCIVGSHAVIENCCIGNGVQIGDGAVLRSCIVADRARIDGRVVLEDACVPEDTVVPAESCRNIPLCWHTEGPDGICFGMPRRNTPETALHAGAAVTVLGKRIAVGFSGNGESYARIAAAGAASQGADVREAGECTLSQLLYTGQKTGCDGLLWVQGGSAVRFIPRSGNGLPLGDTRRLREGLRAGVSGRILPQGRLLDARSFTRLWQEEMTALLPEAPFHITISCGDPLLRRAAEEIFPQNGGEAITLNLSEDGTAAAAFTPEAGMVSREKLILLTLLSFREKGEALAVPADFHPAAEVFAAKYGGRIMRMHSEGRSSMAAKLFIRQGVCLDGVRLFAHVLRVLHSRSMTLAAAVSLLPPMYTVSRRIPTKLGMQETQRLRRQNPDPAVTIRLPAMSRMLELRVHGASMETASELCGFWEKKIRKMEDDQSLPTS